MQNLAETAKSCQAPTAVPFALPTNSVQGLAGSELNARFAIDCPASAQYMSQIVAPFISTLCRRQAMRVCATFEVKTFFVCSACFYS